MYEAVLQLIYGYLNAYFLVYAQKHVAKNAVLGSIPIRGIYVYSLRRSGDKMRFEVEFSKASYIKKYL